MTVSQKYLEFISLVQALNTIVFGDDTAEVTLDGITKPSISKFLAQVDALTTAELQRLRDAIDVVMNQQSVPTTIVTDGTHSQEWINSDFRAALQALNDWIDTKGLPNGYASLDANGTIPNEQLPISIGGQATETALGGAKIATTAIARAGTNDTDSITAKKMRDALNASGGAPISACRAWVNFGASGGVITVKGSLNIASVTRVSAGVYNVNFNIPMPIENYAVFVSNSGDVYSGARINATSDTSNPTIKTVNSVQVAVSRAGSFADTTNVSVGVFC